MLIDFFFALRSAGLRVSLTEFLSLLAALDARVAFMSAQEFYFLARTALIKDERHYDAYDRVFAAYFTGKEAAFARLLTELPADWLQGVARRGLSAEEQAQIKSLGGWEQLLETLRERLAEQKERHSGGNRWIGTGGTSAFGAQGYNPEGVRIGQQQRGTGRAVKVWDQRVFRDLDDGRELDTRNFKMALRRLRRFAREGAAEELDLDGTISATARNAGLLDVKMRPERRNAVKVLLLLDVGGSMDPHIRLCEQLFSAARSEFKHLISYYFHNFPYERLWRRNSRREAEQTSTLEVLRSYSRDYRVIFVGDATMSPYEIEQPGGSVEHWNAESGAVWNRRSDGLAAANLCSAFGLGSAFERLDIGEHFLRVTSRSHLFVVAHDLALRIDQEGIAPRDGHRSHLRQHAVLLGGFLGGIREQ
jgi:uncharacterized protein with von Willebrand factor type A (vWA) domain